MIKKTIVQIFDITFINFHFKKKYTIEEAEKIAYNNISLLISFFLFSLFIMFFVIIGVGLFKLKITRLYLYLILSPIVLLLYFKRNLIKNYFIKPNIDFSIDKYSEEYIKSCKKKNVIFVFAFGIIGALCYAIMRLGSWYLYHI